MQKLIFLSNKIFLQPPNHPIVSQTIISRYRNAPYRTEATDFQDDIYGVRLYYSIALLPRRPQPQPRIQPETVIRIKLFSRISCGAITNWRNIMSSWKSEASQIYGALRCPIISRKIIRSRLVADEGKKGQRRNSNFFLLSRIKLIAKKCVWNYAWVLASNFVLRNLI